MAYESTESVGADLRQGFTGTNQGVHAQDLEGGTVQVRPSQQSRSFDEAVKRLKQLRDSFKQRGDIAKAAGVEASLRALRGML